MKPETISVGMSRRFFRRLIPAFIISLLIGIGIADYYVSNPLLNNLQNEITREGTIISAFIGVVATIYLIWMNFLQIYSNVSGKRNNKTLFSSSVFIVVYVIFCGLALSTPQLTAGTVYTLVYTTILGYLTTVFFANSSIWGSWMIFVKVGRMHTLEGFVLLFAVLVRMFTTPVLFYAIYPPINDLNVWLQQVPDAAVQRAVLGCASVGSVILALRALVNKEPSLAETEAA